jgi:hypothetical protein
MNKFYDIDRSKCSNNGFARLERKFISDFLANHPAFRNFVMDYQECSTKNEYTLKSKERIYTNFKNGLKERLMQNPANRETVFLRICDSCTQNPLCENYQDYQRSILEQNSAVAD